MPGSDKTQHAMTFGALMLLAVSAYPKARLIFLGFALSAFGAAIEFVQPQGGLFVWAKLPEGADALAMLNKAVERNVAYVPGTHFYFDGGRLNTMRLNFSNGQFADVAEGMARLTPVILETIEKTEGSK